jgi:dTDP-4-dehydrorhamnose 3,5-epimerase
VKFHSTPIHGAMLIELDFHEDRRGVFAEGFVSSELRNHGILFDVRRMNISTSRKGRTVRGLHWQKKPYEQGKIVYSVGGRIFDVIVDVRPKSPTFGKMFHVELLPSENALYIPRGVAHGWQSLAEPSTLLYLVDEKYSPEHERGIHPLDPEIAIPWPMLPDHVNDRDAAWPTFSEIARLRDEKKAMELADVCLCERNADGRCDSCATKMVDHQVMIVSVIAESKKRIDETSEQRPDVCEICEKQEMDYVLSRSVRMMANVIQEIPEAQEQILTMFMGIKKMRIAQDGTTSWPLFDKAIREIQSAMNLRKSSLEEEQE